jgi:hypothetical protein
MLRTGDGCLKLKQMVQNEPCPRPRRGTRAQAEASPRVSDDGHLCAPLLGAKAPRSRAVR